MDLKLKSVKYYESMSEETGCFQADLWVGNKKVAHVKNNGHGGCDDYRPYPNMKTLFNEVEAHCKALPKVVWEHGTLSNNLELETGRLLSEFLDKKVLSQNSRKGLLYKNADGKTKLIGWSVPFSKMIKHPQGLKKVLERAKQLQSEGCTILNNNLGTLLSE